MAKTRESASLDWAGRRIKLRDLKVLLAVGEAGTMSKAAERLAVSHPVVSKTISALERTLDVRLFDRTSRGVEPTQFGRALIDCGNAVFDDLRRGIRRIEFLNDPTAGELRIGGTEPIVSGIISATIESLVGDYPRIEIHVLAADSPSLHRALRERRLDLIVSRIFRSATNEEEEIRSEFLFEEHLYVAAGVKSRWARRRKVELDDLRNEPWVVPDHQNAVGALIAEGFRSSNLAPLKPQVISNSMAIRTNLVANRGFLTMMPGSMLHLGIKAGSIKALPVRLPMRSQPVEVVTLKSRTPTPVARLFVERLHAVAKQLDRSRKAAG